VNSLSISAHVPAPEYDGIEYAGLPAKVAVSRYRPALQHISCSHSIPILMKLAVGDSNSNARYALLLAPGPPRVACTPNGASTELTFRARGYVIRTSPSN
jgi:hypothetical protein